MNRLSDWEAADNWMDNQTDNLKDNLKDNRKDNLKDNLKDNRKDNRKDNPGIVFLFFFMKFDQMSGVGSRDRHT